MDKQRVIFFVGTNPPPGKESEFNTWYDDVHVPMLLKAPGMVMATRYQLVGEKKVFPSTWLYMRWRTRLPLPGSTRAQKGSSPKSRGSNSGLGDLTSA